MPLVGVGAHRGDHLGKICLGVRKAHVTRRTRDIVEHKGLVTVIQKRKRHGILLMRSDMRKRTSAADNHGRAAAIRFIGQRLGTQIRKGRRIFLGRLLAPQRHGSRQSYVLPSRKLSALVFCLQAYPT